MANISKTRLVRAITGKQEGNLKKTYLQNKPTFIILQLLYYVIE